MPRVIVPEAEALIGEVIPCLDKGHVQLVDYMGGDQSVVQAARVSYAKDLQPFDLDKDSKLINYLMAHRHTTPFEMVQLKVRMKLPIFVARQWVRHRTATLNEVSARYTQLPDDFYVPDLHDILPQSKDNKQGRQDDGSFTEDDQLMFQAELEGEQREAYAGYDTRVQKGMAKELARVNLPVSIYTEWYWDQNLWNMLHLLGLRMDGHAQKEIRVYANALWRIVQAVAPISAAAWENHFFLGARFSRDEMELLRACMERVNLGEKKGMGWADGELAAKLGDRGAAEFITKLKPYVGMASGS